jgi:hypothetical protein
VSVSCGGGCFVNAGGSAAWVCVCCLPRRTPLCFPVGSTCGLCACIPNTRPLRGWAGGRILRRKNTTHWVCPCAFHLLLHVRCHPWHRIQTAIAIGTPQWHQANTISLAYEVARLTTTSHPQYCSTLAVSPASQCIMSPLTLLPTSRASGGLSRFAHKPASHRETRHPQHVAIQ